MYDILHLVRSRAVKKYIKLEDTSSRERFTDEDFCKLRKAVRRVDQNESVISIHDVDKDCSLANFCADEGLVYSRGCFFYEFNHDDVEHISDDKRLIFLRNVCTCILHLYTYVYSIGKMYYELMHCFVIVGHTRIFLH